MFDKIKVKFFVLEGFNFVVIFVVWYFLGVVILLVIIC